MQNEQAGAMPPKGGEQAPRQCRVSMEVDGFSTIRFKNHEVLIEADGDSVILDAEQAWQAAMLIFGTESQRIQRSD